MATSGTVDWSLTSRQIITEALENIGAVALGDTPSSEDAAKALSVLNQMVKTWGTQGHLWTLTEGSVSLVADTASYVLTAARRVISVRRRTSSQDIPLGVLTRDQYYNLPNKSSSGYPISYYFDPQRSTKTLYVWQVPTAAIVATTTLQYTYQRVIEDLDDLDNDPDFPQEWMETLVYGLAARLLIPYSVHQTNGAKAEKIEERAALLFDQLTTDDLDGASVIFQPADR